MPNIPQSRLILYLLIAGLIPIFLVSANFLSKKNTVDQLQLNLQRVQFLSMERERKQALNMTVREHFKNADHFYIDKNLENLTFLKPEVETLRTLLNNKYYAGDENVKRRIDYITGTQNSILFSEGNVENYPFFQETTDTLVHPVEINLDDLKKILALIEGKAINGYEPGPNKPQLIILDFKIEKKDPTENNEVFLLNLKLLKREYT